MGLDRTKVLIAALTLATGAQAQEVGWHYSPLPGEGDRAALGCALDSTQEVFACIAVRCEDDYTTGVHIHTSRTENGAGTWAITIDKETRSFEAVADNLYGARLVGDYAWVLDNLANGAVAYLEPLAGSAMPANHIPLDGSLYAINRALSWCAPRTPKSEPKANSGVTTDQSQKSESSDGPPPSRTQ